MGKRKFNILLNISVMCLCICAIIFGVYSAKNASLNVSGTIGFTAHACDVYVFATISGGATVDSNGTLNAHVSSFGSEIEYKLISSKNTDAQNTWSFGDIVFNDINNTDTNKKANDIIITIKIYNTSSFKVTASYNKSFLINEKISVSTSAKSLSLSANETISNIHTITVTLSLLDDSENIEKITCGNLLNFEKEETFNESENLNISASSDGAGAVINGLGECTDTVVVIPEKVTINGVTKTVTEIGVSAFENKTNITTVIIPEGVTKIYSGAFAGCTSLKTVKIPSTVTDIYAMPQGGGGPSLVSPFANTNCEFVISEDNANFKVDYTYNVVLSKDGKTLIFGNNVSTGIPSTVTTIGMSSFNACKLLKSITIPANVTRIYQWAFKNCTALTSVVFVANTGWRFASSTELSETDLSVPTTAAMYLSSKYCEADWIRS